MREFCETALGNAVRLCVLACATFAAPAIAQQCTPSEIVQFLPVSSSPDLMFGFSVAINGNRAVVGVPDDPGVAPHGGRVYVYHFDGKAWTQETAFSSNDVSEGDFFGSSVSISQGVVLAGAPGDNVSGARSGSAYVFRHDGVAWVEEAKLVPTDGAATDFFGASVSLSGPIALIGAERNDENGTNSGSAYVFSYGDGSWDEQTKLLASDGDEYDAFGVAVAISGNLAVVGAPQDSDHGNSSGSVYTYRFDGVQWAEEAKIVPVDGNAADFFGESVAVSGNTLLAGAHWDDDQGSNSGSAYIFAHDGLQWEQQAKLFASDGASSEQFGWSVSIWGEVAVVGANEASAVLNEDGAGYVFSRNTLGQWNEVAKLSASDPGVEDAFGNAIAISNKQVLVGAFAHDEIHDDSGAAYIFDLQCPCPADLAEPFGGVLNLQDVFAYLALFNAQDPAADLAEPIGTLNLQDVFGYLALFNAGCP